MALSLNIQAVSVLNPDSTLNQLEISWMPVVIGHIGWLHNSIRISLQGGNVTTYTVRVVGSDSSVGQGCTVCTTSPCLYVHQVTHMAHNYNISVTSINQDAKFGFQNSITFSELKNTNNDDNSSICIAYILYQLYMYIRCVG